MSPTLLSTWAVQRLRLRSYPRGKRALVRLATLARTSSLLLLYRSWAKDQIWECWPHHCQYKRDKRNPILNLSLEWRKFWDTFITRSQTRENKVEIHMSLQESYPERERILSEHREIGDFFDLRPNHAAQGEKAALSRLSGAEYHTILLLEEQKNHVLSEARSELNMQELRVENADRAVQESSLQLHYQRMGSTERISNLIVTRERERRFGQAQKSFFNVDHVTTNTKPSHLAPCFTFLKTMNW